MSRAKVKLPPIPKGHARRFVRCKGCKRVYYRDFVPYSFGGRFLAIPCSCSIGHQDWNLEDITEAVFHRERVKEIRKEERQRTAARLT